MGTIKMIESSKIKLLKLVFILTKKEFCCQFRPVLVFVKLFPSSIRDPRAKTLKVIKVSKSIRDQPITILALKCRCRSYSIKSLKADKNHSCNCMPTLSQGPIIIHYSHSTIYPPPLQYWNYCNTQSHLGVSDSAPFKVFVP